MELGREHWRYIRREIQRLLSPESPLSADERLKKTVLIPTIEAESHLPISIGDYTDFYASKEHAMNVGTMFRGKDNALNPNWYHYLKPNISS
jgi:fumarylacetoacetase